VHPVPDTTLVAAAGFGTAYRGEAANLDLEQLSGVLEARLQVPDVFEKHPWNTQANLAALKLHDQGLLDIIGLGRKGRARGAGFW
jgi:hypothetical protein